MLSEKRENPNVPNSSNLTPRSEGVTSQVSTLSGTPSRIEKNVHLENPNVQTNVKQHPVQYWNPNGCVYYTVGNGNNPSILNNRVFNEGMVNMEASRKPIGVRRNYEQVVPMPAPAELTPSGSYYGNTYIPGRYDTMSFNDSTNQFCTDLSSVMTQGIGHLSDIGRDWIHHQKDSLLHNINNSELVRDYYIIPDKASELISNLGKQKINAPQYIHENEESFRTADYYINPNYGYSYAYQPPYLNRNREENDCLSLCLPFKNTCNHSYYEPRVKETDLGICQSFLLATGCASGSPRERKVRTKSPGELILTPILSGINKLINTASDFTLNLLPRVPDKDAKYPGTGCTVIDVVNDALDHTMNEQPNTVAHMNYVARMNNTQKTDIPVFDWINENLDRVHEGYTVRSKPRPKNKNNDIGLSNVVFGSCYRSTDYVDPYDLAKNSLNDCYRRQRFVPSQTPTSHHLSPRMVTRRPYY